MAITSKDVGTSILTGVMVSLVSLLVKAIAKAGGGEPEKEASYGESGKRGTR